MRRLLALLLALALAFYPALAQAAIGTPTAISAVTVSGTASGSPISTTVDAPIGSLIVVVGFAGVGATINSMTLSSGDACSLAVQNSSGSGVESGSIWYCSNTAHDLPSGGTITATTSSGTYGLGAFKISGANGGVDKMANNSNGAATSNSQAIGAFCGASSIVLAVNVFNLLLTAWTEGSGFTQFSGGNGVAYDMGYDIVSASTAVTYAPSWTPSAGTVLIMANFAATGTCSATTAIHRGLLLGVG